MANDEDLLDIRGIRTNNLKNIDIRIRHGEFVVITGPSGSGKSSLAFDTIFAEGRRQFLNSLSLRARQSLQFLPRPEIDFIRGIQPVVCIDQQKGKPNPRSTVGTVSEIYDRLKLLMARVGTVRCSSCENEISQSTREEIEFQIMQFPERTKVMVLAPSRNDSGNLREILGEIRKAGYVRARINEEIVDIDSAEQREWSEPVQVEAVVDRLIVKEGIGDRLAESLGQALKLGEESLALLTLRPDDTEWEYTRYNTTFACPDCNVVYEEMDVRTFNFNSPFGACPVCSGVGTQERFSFERVFADPTVPITQLPVLGILTPSRRKKLLEEWQLLMEKHGLDQNLPLGKIDDRLRQLLFRGESSFLGLVTLLEKEYVTTTQPKKLEEFDAFRNQSPCSKCGGSRLCEAANHVFVGNRNIGELVNLSLTQARHFFSSVADFPDSEKLQIAEPILSEICQRLDFLIEVGAGYLTLGRRADSLSGGEFQRVRLATGIGNGLTGACYILDEPTIGLHPEDNKRLIASILKLKKQENTIIAVEHDKAIMEVADRMIDIGPGAGIAGGEILAEGSLEELKENNRSVTGRYLRNDPKAPVSKTRRGTTGWIELKGASLNNLKGDLLRIPTGRFVCITGVSGSGKSSLIHGTLIPAIQSQLGRPRQHGPFESLSGISRIRRVIEIDQQPIGRSSRSNAATFSGMFDEIRKLYATTRLAKQRGYTASRFSFNNKEGACVECGGNGQKRIELSFMPDLFVTCEECAGRRYNDATLEPDFKGLNISQVLDLSVAAAQEVFANVPRILRYLDSMASTGLGYLKIGQTATALSGGEAQRLKIATELATPTEEPTLYVFDEPTTGLHFLDISRLFQVLEALVTKGHTVLVIEHNLELVRNADHVIDMGPCGGEEGGKIVATGTPAEVAACPESRTGFFLSKEAVV